MRRRLPLLLLGKTVRNVPAFARAATSTPGAELYHVYTAALHGFAATLPDQAVQALQRNPNVESIHPDILVRAVGSGSSAAQSWGLDRIDQRLLPLDGQYDWATSGQGVHYEDTDLGAKPKGTCMYFVCQVGNPDNCSNEVLISF